MTRRSSYIVYRLVEVNPTAATWISKHVISGSGSILPHAATPDRQHPTILRFMQVSPEFLLGHITAYHFDSFFLNVNYISSGVLINSKYWNQTESIYWQNFFCRTSSCMWACFIYRHRLFYENYLYHLYDYLNDTISRVLEILTLKKTLRGQIWDEI